MCECKRNCWALGKYCNEYYARISLVTTGGEGGKGWGVVEMNPNSPIEILESRGQVWR